MRALSLIAVILGMVLLIGSLVWAILFPATRTWTDEKSQRMSDLGVQAHKLGAELDAAKRSPSMHAGKSPADIEAEYKKVTAELDQLRAEFEGKRDAPKTAATVLRWSGIAFVAAGALIVFANREG